MARIGLITCLLVSMAIAISVINARSASLSVDVHRINVGAQETQSIYATGFVEGVTEDVQLRMEQIGRVTSIMVSAGDQVDAGTVLITLDDSRQKQEVALAVANLEYAEAEVERIKNGATSEAREVAHALYRSAQARLDQAMRTWTRIQQLRTERAVSQQEADDQLASVDALRGEVEAAAARVREIESPARADEMRAAAARVGSAQASLELARIALAQTQLIAPRASRVLDVNSRVGELTGPNAPLPVVVLSDTSEVRVRAYVEELDAPRIALGMRASARADGLPGQVFNGAVIAISPQMNTKTLHADRPNELYDTKVREVVIELEPTSALINGLRVDIDIRATVPEPPLTSRLQWPTQYAACLAAHLGPRRLDSRSTP